MKISQDVLDRAFAQLEAAAITGSRCPMSDSVVGGSPSVSQLARDGRILVEVFVHNFRRVTILQGEHRGKTTANAPLRGGLHPRPYLTVTTAGTRRNGVLIDTGWKGRTQPSIRDYSGGYK